MQQVQIQQVEQSRYLDVLQVYRGFAALLVVIHHAVGSLRFYHNIDSSFLNIIGAVGKFGVDFFFVLSGFIIAYSVHFKYNKPNAFRDYVLARFLRIYIPYLPIGIGILLLYTLVPSFSNSGREISVFTSITLIPHGSPALSVAWTLLFELMFYFLFSITFFSKKIWNIFIIVWSLLILMHNYSGVLLFSNLKSPFLELFLSTYNFEFLFGFLLAQMILKRIELNYWFTLLMVLFFGGLFLVDIFNKSELFYFSNNLLFALFVFSLIYFSVQYFNIRLEKKNLLMLVGNATYSIYLVHNPLQAFLIRFWPKISTTVSLLLVLVITILVCSVAGYVYYSIFEKWGIAKVKMSIDRKLKRV